jgi:multidrug efflux pump
MNFTDLFIRKPVLATTVSLLILVLGVRSLLSLSVRQYPKTQNAVVTISTAYYGADAATVAGFITQPLEGAIAQAQGIDYLSSTSTSGVSSITATLRLNYDANRALPKSTPRSTRCAITAARWRSSRCSTCRSDSGSTPCTWAFRRTTPNNNITDTWFASSSRSWTR